MKRKVFSFVLAAAVLFCALPYGAFAEAERDFEYEIINGEAKITGYRGIGGDVVIPSEIEGHPVVRIGYYAFSENDTIVSITIPNGVTGIQAGAFSDCDSLINVIIPNSMSWIEFNTFSYCDALTEITIPASVKSLGLGAFEGCANLRDVYFEASKAEAESSGEWDFQWNYFYDGNIWWNGYRSDGTERDFYFTVGDDGGVTVTTYRGNYAETDFEVVIPAVIEGHPVVAIGDDLFYDEIFGGGDPVAAIVLPDSIETIGAGAFCGTNLKEVLLPSGVTKIGDNAFAWCESLERAVIPDSVTTIYSGAFAGCTSLTEIYVPDSVEHMSLRVFSSCEALTDIYCEAESKPENWNELWLGDCNATVHWGAKPLVTYGDADGDGEINGLDVTRLMKYFVSVNYADGSCSVELADGADCNGDGVIDGRDVVRLLRYLADFDPTTGTSSVALGK